MSSNGQKYFVTIAARKDDYQINIFLVLLLRGDGLGWIYLGFIIPRLSGCGLGWFEFVIGALIYFHLVPVRRCFEFESQNLSHLTFFRLAFLRPTFS